MKQKKPKDQKKEKGRVQGFQVIDQECVWMKAGVINFRLCDNAYDCYTCGFDRGMRKAMRLENDSSSKSSEPEWASRLREQYRGAERPCRHALTGRVNAPKICTMNYECFHCPYDQMLDEMELSQPLAIPSYAVASGYRLAQEYYYHMGHCWARFEHGGRVRVGFDDFLTKVFGSPAQIRLPSLGAKVTQNQMGWTFARDGHKAASLSPVTGTVLAVNQRVQATPGISHADPYHEGWLLIVEPHMPKRDLRGLYFGEESFRWMEHEVKTLMGLMGTEYEQLSATGGAPVGDLFGHYPEVGWDRLVKTFLRTEKL
jgi:glycine cleavage system H lipoate-binding protein